MSTKPFSTAIASNPSYSEHFKNILRTCFSVSIAKIFVIVFPSI
ncbi:hypothetical protein [Nostoc sp. FACHB-892]|nr:hypothetical protein [Nostoc sp. FACHB-892]